MKKETSMRLKILSAIGYALGIQFKVDEIPYGAPYRSSVVGETDQANTTV